MLRFYYQFVFDKGYELINEPVVSNQIKCYPAATIGFPCTKFVEIQLDRLTMGIMRIIPMDVPYINGAALKAANDHNVTLLAAPKDESKQVHARDYKYQANQVVERALQYGDEFLVELAALMEKFPLKKVVIPIGMKVFG